MFSDHGLVGGRWDFLSLASRDVLLPRLNDGGSPSAIPGIPKTGLLLASSSKILTP